MWQRAVLLSLFGPALFFACGSDDDAAPGAAAGRGASSGKAGAGARDGGSAAGGGSGAAGGTGTGGASGGAGGSTGGAGGGSVGSAGAGGSTGGAGASGASGSAGAAGSAGCAAISTFADGRTPTREIHVSTTGDDANDGASANPVRTLGRAVALANAGTAIRIHAGTYAGGTFINGLAGSAIAPIWLGGAPGEARPVIEGGADAMHLVRARYLVIHDLEVRNTTANGINADDGNDRANQDASRYIVFRNLFIHDIGSGGNQDCLKLSGLNDYWVLDSRFARCGGGGSGSAVDHVGCHRGLLARNILEDLQGNGIQCKGGSEQIEIRSTRFLNAGVRAVNMGGSTGYEFFRPPLSTTADNYEARTIKVIANVFVGSQSPIALVGCVDCLVANNTVVDPDNWIIRILQETPGDATYRFLPARNGRLINNLFYFNRSSLSTYVNVGANTAPDTFVFQNNLWYAHDAPAQSQPNLPAQETAAIHGQNPALRNVAGGDYSIPGTSPAARTGRALTELSADFAGNCWGTPPSVGAFEAN